MKNVILLLTAFSLLLCCRKTPPVKNPGGSAGDSNLVTTSKGDTIGKLRTTVIDQFGGTAFSADSVIEIIFPAGALKAKTNIGIQAISNQCPDSILPAYRFTPDGLKFDKQPTLIIHYPDSAVAGTYAKELGIAFQDSSGAWNAMNRIVIDSIHQKLSAAIPHFSDWATFAYMAIFPGASTVKVSKVRQLNVGYLPRPSDTGGNAAPIHRIGYYQFTNWSVNGIPSGNDAVGNIAKITSNGDQALFGAPASVPSPSTVTVSVETPVGNSGKGLLVARITIYDTRYDVKLTQDNNIGFAYLYAMHDEASYSIILHKNTGDIVNIKNQPPDLNLLASTPCTEFISPFNGSINVVNPTGVTVGADNSVNANFPATVRSLVSATIICPGAPSNPTKQYPLDELNGTISFAKTDAAVQIRQYRPDGAVIVFTITPVNK